MFVFCVRYPSADLVVALRLERRRGCSRFALLSLISVKFSSTLHLPEIAVHFFGLSAHRTARLPQNMLVSIVAAMRLATSPPSPPEHPRRSKAVPQLISHVCLRCANHSTPITPWIIHQGVVLAAPGPGHLDRPRQQDQERQPQTSTRAHHQLARVALYDTVTVVGQPLTSPRTMYAWRNLACRNQINLYARRSINARVKKIHSPA